MRVVNKGAFDGPVAAFNVAAAAGAAFAAGDARPALLLFCFWLFWTTLMRFLAARVCVVREAKPETVRMVRTLEAARFSLWLLMCFEAILLLRYGPPSAATWLALVLGLTQAPPGPRGVEYRRAE